jgi:integrase
VGNRIQRVADREKLKPRRTPYWVTVRQGFYLGFRLMTAGSAGSWSARYTDPRTGEQPQTSFGKLDSIPPAERYDAALKLAEAWFQHVGLGGAPQRTTVRQAAERYVERLRRERGEAAATRAVERLGPLVYAHRIASVQLSDLRRQDLAKWRDWLTNRPADVTRGKDKDSRETRQRAPQTIDRDMAVLRAALNLAHRDGLTASDAAWKGALSPTGAKSGRRNIYLDRDERVRMIEAASAEARPFVRLLCVLPLRPGAAAALRVDAYDPRTRSLKIGQDKTGPRVINVPPATAAFLADCVRNKLPGAHLVARGDGRPWDKDTWGEPVKEAAVAAGLPKATVAYSLRHSAITDLVHNGLDLLTVAQISGTSVRMIEEHYGHLRQEHAEQALAALSLP